MESHPNGIQPTNFQEYPGKLDHTTCVVIQAGQSDLSDEIKNMEKLVIKLRNPMYGFKANIKEGDLDTSFIGSDLIQWIKNNYKDTIESLTIIDDEKALSISQQLLNLSHILPIGPRDYNIEEFNLDTRYCFKTFDPIMTEFDWISIQRASQIKHFQKGQTIVHENQEQTKIYQIISGRCLISKTNSENIKSLDLHSLDKKVKPRARTIVNEKKTKKNNRDKRPVC